MSRCRSLRTKVRQLAAVRNRIPHFRIDHQQLENPDTSYVTTVVTGLAALTRHRGYAIQKRPQPLSLLCRGWCWHFALGADPADQALCDDPKHRIGDAIQLQPQTYQPLQ
jgi:hypothetical protein